MRSKALWCGVILVAAAAIMCCTSQSWAAEKQAGDQAQNQFTPPDRGSVIVYFEKGADRGPARQFVQNKGGRVHYEYDVALPNAVNFRGVPDSAIAGLQQVPGVARVERDEYHPDLVKLDESTPLIRALQSQITGAGLSADGSGIRVCVCDTGIDSDHIMYTDRIDTAAGYDFYNDDSNPEDDNGHGSHVSGIAVGGVGLSVDFGCDGSEPFQGVAPAATLIGVKILNQFGGGYDSDIIAGIDYCASATMPNGPADVINLSIGTGSYSSTCDSHGWAAAANNAVDAGVVVVAASGNECNSNSMGSPACGSKVIAVGATYKDTYPNCEDGTSNFNWSCCNDSSPAVDSVVCFSNQSDYLDVTAPGAMIWSASTESGGSTITTMAGTSMASPQVAGLAALVLSADPTLTPSEVRQIIRDGAIDMGSAGFDRAYGYGRVDAINSLQLVQPCTSNADCDDGLFCNGAETCDAGTCVAGTDPCPGEDCDEVSDVCVPIVCDNDGTCESGEDCNNCPNDCISGTGGATCGNGLCEAGDGEDCRNCPADCNGRTTGAPSGRFCCGATEGCGDSRCNDGGYSCTTTPQGTAYCCGDGICEGAEDDINCAIDCATGCTSAADCDDANECTTDACVSGVCENTAVADDTACSGGICCGGSCTAAVCYVDGDCGDGEACTTDTCLNAGTCSAACDNTWPACGLSDSCCGPTCDSSNDPDCDTCVPAGGYCDTNADCCSLSCHPAKNYCR